MTSAPARFFESDSMLGFVTACLLEVPLEHHILYILNSIDPQASPQQLKKWIQAEGVRAEGLDEKMGQAPAGTGPH